VEALKLYSTAQAAGELGVKRQQALKIARRLRVERVGHGYVWTTEDVERAKHRKTTPGPDSFNRAR
jgi:hypothetical protein